MKTLEERVEAIEKRNQKVELDKKWETSWTSWIFAIDISAQKSALRLARHTVILHLLCLRIWHSASTIYSSGS